VAEDGSFAVVYSPMGDRFTLDLGILRPGLLRQSWFDPRYGTLHPFITADLRAFQTCTPPTCGRGRDWVLALDIVT